MLGIEELLPPGLRGLMLVGLLAALASTIDTHLNWGASYWSNDVYRRLIAEQWLSREPGRRELVAVARLSNILILAIALVIMVNLDAIQTAWFISLLFGAGMGSVLVLRWLWERINLNSELAAIVVSLVVAPVLLITTDTEWIRLSVMSLVSTVAAVGITFVTPRTDGTVLRIFYRQVAPDGFWGRTAASLGEDARVPRRRLARGLKWVLLTAASLFLLLVGVGQLLLAGAPGGSVPLAIFWVLAGLALVPFWIRGLGTDDPDPDLDGGPQVREDG